MAYLVIPTDTTSLFHDQSTQLEGKEYLLQFYWSDREAAWYLGIYDQDENALATGIRLVLGWPLLRRFADPRLPPGALFCVDMTGKNREIASPDDLNTRVLLFYITSDDLDLA